MKLLFFTLFLAFSASAHVEVGRAVRVTGSSTPRMYPEMLEAKRNALLQAMRECKSETVRRLDKYTYQTATTVSSQCRAFECREVILNIILATADFECLEGPVPEI